jgi:DNA-binding FadR family transcriptional regulator
MSPDQVPHGGEVIPPGERRGQHAAIFSKINSDPIYSPYINRASLERLWDRQDARKQLVKQHEAIWAAIRARDPEKAAQAAHEHLSYVETVLRDTR